MNEQLEKTRIVVTRKWTETVEKELQNSFETVLNASDKVLTKSEIRSRCKGATVLCTCSADLVDAELINSLPESIRLIANFGAGVDNLDVAAALERNILVSNTPGVVAEEAADLIFGLILASSRRFVEGDNLVRSGNWNEWGITFMLGSRVYGKILGIVGLGNIGTAVAKRSQGFRMRVIYHNRTRNLDAEAKVNARYCASLNELLREADIIVLTCPLNNQTYHLIKRESFTEMKPSCIFINASRGPVVDEEALIDALSTGQIRAAGLDVYNSEPVVSARLRAQQNTVLLPHIATATEETRTEMGMMVINNIKAFLGSGKVINQVVPG